MTPKGIERLAKLQQITIQEEQGKFVARNGYGDQIAAGATREQCERRLEGRCQPRGLFPGEYALGNGLVYGNGHTYKA